MPVLDISLQGDGAWPDVDLSKVIHLGENDPLRITALPGGMSSGKTSVAIRFDLPDGRIVIAETSLALLESAVRAFRAKYG